MTSNLNESLEDTQDFKDICDAFEQMKKCDEEYAKRSLELQRTLYDYLLQLTLKKHGNRI